MIGERSLEAGRSATAIERPRKTVQGWRLGRGAAGVHTALAAGSSRGLSAAGDVSRRRGTGAGDRVRTDDIQLGKPRAEGLPPRENRVGAPSLSLPLSLPKPKSDLLALADELLAAAEKSSNPAPLIAAARALVAEASGKPSGAIERDPEAQADAG